MGINFEGSLGSKSYFFWLLESRSNPSTDPLVIWLTGGPGCSSQLALFAENGPCSVNENGDGTILKESSWTNKANVIWVDQPAGAGFSSGIWDYNENGVAIDFYAFLQGFYKELPQYKNHSLYITGESYAGHYVPAISHHIWEMNQNAEDIMRAAVAPCTALIHECNAGIPIISEESCLAAFIVCNYGEQIPYTLSGYNPYDMRIKCDVFPLCYDFAYIDTYLNRADVQETLGADGKWESCNMLVNKLFMADFMTSYHKGIPDLLHDDIEVLIYAGDVDYICNWLGNKKWVLDLEWEGKNEFNLAEDKPWNLTTGENMGRLRSHKNFKFLQVYNAGHMVPMDQPKAADEMLFSWLDGTLGEETLKQEHIPKQADLSAHPNIIVIH